MTRGTEDNATEIARLTHEGLECKDRDPEEAIQKFHIAYQKSRLIDDDYTERVCAFNLGAAYVCADKAREGLKFLHKAIPPESEIESRSSSDLYFNMGMAYEKLADDRNALKYYEKAYEEFRISGGSNVSLEMHCLQKCLELQEKLKRFVDAANVYKQMALISNAKKDYLNQAECLCKMATQYQKAKNLEAAAEAARECQNVFNNMTPEGKECFVAARILNELGLLCTQIQNYDIASQCFERALQLVNEGEGENLQLEVVVKQNLGAAYNFLGDFQRAIKFHEEAIDLHTKLKYRNGQGQCFTNLAFALSQEPHKDLRQAEVAFHHALRASIETGDTNMKWQVLEGLGAVNYQQGNFEDAINRFQDALQWSVDNKVASERIKGKLRLTTEYFYALRNTRGKGRTPDMATVYTTEQLGTIPERPNTQQPLTISQESPIMSRIQQQAPAPIESESPPRRLIPFRKRDSFAPHLPKVARGLTTMSLESDRATPRGQGLLVTQSDDSSDNSEGESGASSSRTSSSEDEDGEQIQSERVQEIFAAKKESHVLAGTAADSPYGDHRESQADRYQQALREKEAREEEESEDESSSESETDEDSSSSEDSEDSEDEMKHQTRPKRVISPPVPTQSPPCTSEVRTQDLATYQVAQNYSHASASGSSNRAVKVKTRRAESKDSSDEEEEEEENTYAVIDQAKMSRRQPAEEGNDFTNGERIVSPQHRRTGRKGSNFFDSEDELDLKESERQSNIIEAPSPRGESEGSDSDQPRDGPSHEQPNISRAQQEKRLFWEHQRYTQEQAEGPPLPPRGNEKQSKTCSIM